jgi:hypothetical protein
MARFLVTYHGAGMPEGDDARQQAMEALGRWLAQAGKAVVDPGAPLGPSKIVTAASVAHGPASGPAGGYSIVEAADIEAAVGLVMDHPFVGRGEALQVSAAIAP